MAEGNSTDGYIAQPPPIEHHPVWRPAKSSCRPSLHGMEGLRSPCRCCQLPMCLWQLQRGSGNPFTDPVYQNPCSVSEEKVLSGGKGQDCL